MTSESKAWIRDQLEAGATGVELPGPAGAADDQAGAESGAEATDQQDEEQAPWMADRAFYDALVPAAQRDMLAGADMSREYGAWTRGEVDTGPSEPDLPTFELELPMSGDECMEQADLWAAIAAEGGDEETSAEDALTFSEQWALQGRATMIQEARSGKRQAYTLPERDARAVIQAEVDARIEAGRQKWGRDR